MVSGSPPRTTEGDVRRDMWTLSTEILRSKIIMTVMINKARAKNVVLIRHQRLMKEQMALKVKEIIEIKR